MFATPSKRLLSLAAGLLCMASAQATLHDRGNGLIYDDVLNVTWLQNANLAATETFDVLGIDEDGVMDLKTAWEYIAEMNAVAYKGITTWTMPKLTPANGVSWQPFNNATLSNGTGDVGYNITSNRSWLSNLHYATLGNKGFRDINGNINPGTAWIDYGMVNAGPFTNTGPHPLGGTNVTYWTDSTPVQDFGSFATVMVFNTRAGYQFSTFNDSFFRVWAVAPGDVAVAVPEPTSLALMLAGVGVVGLRLRRKASAA
jgi:PEP-CTERM motif